MDGVILLTGATGLLGRYLIRDLTLSGQKLAVVVRPHGRRSAQERIDRIVASWEQQGYRDLPTPKTFAGDLTQPSLGLNVEDRRWIASQCDMVLHSAASLSFETARNQEEEPWRTNLGGTRNVLELCRETGLHDFHQVSTAYVCGLRTGRILETELDEGQEFGNDYERSKLQSEQLVRNADFLAPPTVYRPSIIVGDSTTGFTTTFHGFYALLKLAVTLGRMLDDIDQNDWMMPLHELVGRETKNLVPVDWVSAVITKIIGRRQHWGATYHLTPTEPVSVGTIRDVVERAVGYEGRTQFTGTAASGHGEGIISEFIAAFYEQMKVYETYWRNDPDFDRMNLLSVAGDLPCPPLDFDRLLKLANEAIRLNFRYRDPKPSHLVTT